MKMISKVATTVLGLAFIGSSVFAQSIADAKKAIDAEQFQKSKSILKNLTTTQPTKGENYFYLGLAYIKTEYPDSAKTAFTKGIAAEEKYALNYVGLGWIDRIDKNAAGAKSNFDKALDMSKKKDTDPYVFIGRGYLLEPNPDANAAIAVLQKGITLNAKDAELHSALGDAYRTQLKNSEAYQSYATALSLDPKLVSAAVATGVIWKLANNFEDSEKEFQKAIAMDANYGPTYRELAETYLRWAATLTTTEAYDEKIKKAAEFYKKYLDLTDLSVESRMRYADFLITAKEYKKLEEEANAIAQMDKSNLRIYRYLGYSGFENEHYQDGLQALTKFFKEADPKRIIPRDYLYMGRLELKTGQDSLGIASLNKAYELDTTQVDLYIEIAKSFYGKKKYVEAATAYEKYIQKSNKKTLNDYLSWGLSNYFAYNEQYFAAQDDSTKKADTSLLTKADSAFSYISQKASAPVADVILYRARVKDLQEPDRNTIKGLAKPLYEQYIEVLTAKANPDDRGKKNLGEAYAYLGSYYSFSENDDVKAGENFMKSREFDPANKQAQAYFDRKTAKPSAKAK
ncbi:MAG: tetratricopeptide repeat protein [Sphingobacteriaceae bacterium]